MRMHISNLRSGTHHYDYLPYKYCMLSMHHWMGNICHKSAWLLHFYRERQYYSDSIARPIMKVQKLWY